MGCFKIVEGCVKYRVGRRWKQRWCILQKLSPVSSCVHICLHKGGQPLSSHLRQPSTVYALEDFCGIDAPFQWDHEQHVMAVVCRQHVVVLAVADKSTLDAWCLAIRCHCGCDHRFMVDIARAPLTLKHTTSALLFVHGAMLCLTTRSGQSAGPPYVLASWTVFDLWRFGVLDNKFCFQVTDISGLNVYALSSVSATEIDRLLREATRHHSVSVDNECVEEMYVRRNELRRYHRSAHSKTSSFDSSSVYTLLSFGSVPETGRIDLIDSDADKLRVETDRLRPFSLGDGSTVRESVKYRHKKGIGKDEDLDSVAGLVSVIPNHYVESAAAAVRQKQLVVSVADRNNTKTTRTETTEDGSTCLSVKDKLSARNGLTFATDLPVADSDNAALQSSNNRISLYSDTGQSSNCPEINCRRYSCGDQLAATWWRFLDRATSYSDLRGLPRSLSRFCCSTWRTFTGVKSPCIDVSKVGSSDPSETSRLHVNAVKGSAADEIKDESMNLWRNKPVSSDRWRLIDIGSDVELSSVRDKTFDCKQMSSDSLQKVPQTLRGSCDSHLSDSDGGGSYVSLKVDCRSIECHSPRQKAVCNDSVPNHTSCDVPDEDSVFSAVELPGQPSLRTTRCVRKQSRNVEGNPEELCPAKSIVSGPLSVDVSSLCPSTKFISCAALQPSVSRVDNIPCQTFTRSLSSGNCYLMQKDQLLMPNNGGYVNLSVGKQSRSLDRQTVCCEPMIVTPDSISSACVQPAVVSVETNSVPSVGSDSNIPPDCLAVHTPGSMGNDPFACRKSLSSNGLSTDKISRKSSNRLLRLIRRGSTKVLKPQGSSARTSSNAAESNEKNVESAVTDLTEPAKTAVRMFSYGNNQPSSLHRLPSPSVPPPPIPDDSATCRLFKLCNTSPVARHSRANLSRETDPLSDYQVLSLVKSCPESGAALSSSYLAADKLPSGSQSLKSNMHEMSSDNIKLASPAHRHGHVRQSSLELFCRSRCGSDQSEVMSVHSSGSDGSAPVQTAMSHLIRHSSSATTSRLRPRYGVEYQRIERRRGRGGFDMVDDCSTSSTPQPSPYSTASSSVFTFDSFSCDGDEQPPPPPLPVRTRRPEPTYINIAPPSRSGSESSSATVEVNYAQIDLTGLSVSQRQPTRRERTEPTPYAVIDLEATAAAARTGREHALLREGLLPGKSVRRPEFASRTATLGRCNRPCASRKLSMPSNYNETSLFDMTSWTSVAPDESDADRS